MNLTLTPNEKAYLRNLAKQQLELSQLPIMQERARDWTLHNDLKGTKPMINFEMWTVQDKGFNPVCTCESEAARNIEGALLGAMANHNMVGDDRVVADEFVCHYRAKLVPFDMPAKREETDGFGFHIISQIDDLNTTALIKPSAISYDLEASHSWRDFVNEQIGDILPVRMGMGSFYACLTNDIVQRMTMENMFIAMLDSPDNFHFMVESISDDYVRFFKGLESRGMIHANNKNDALNQGSYGFCSHLPDIAAKTTDCWGYMDSQETVGVSADMFAEFFFPYYKKVADCFGLLSYGCCEPVHEVWEKSISKFANLRKLSISPWCNEEYMGSALRDRDVIYLRKPSPLYFSSGTIDEDAFRQHIRKTINAAAGCKLEFAFRDVYNLEGDITKPRRAVEILREEIENQ